MMVNTFDWFRKWKAYNPDKEAVKDAISGDKLTYKNINDAANAAAWYLKNKYQLHKGDRIGIISENDLTHVILFALAQKTGAILVPINYRLAPDEVNYMLSDSACKVVFYDRACFDINQLSYSTSYELMGSLYRFVDSEEPEFFEEINEEDPIFILYTSGTTGFPKGTIYTHKMLFWNSINTSLSLIITNNTVTLNCMPLFHTGGWNVLLTPVLHHGGTIIMFKKFDPLEVLNCIVEEQLNLFMAVPTMLKMMVGLPEFSSADMSCLNYIIVGGEKMPLELIKIFHKKRIPIRQGYGLTEVGPNLTSLHQNEAERKQGSIGLPNFYVKMKIVNEEKKETEINEAGELLISGPMVTPGYWNNPEASKVAKSGEYFKTGDIARKDDEGFLYIVDRKKHMYISGGENVYPVEVERVLCEHPAVQEAVVFGIPHDRWGECGVALIVQTKHITQEEIMDYCKNKLAKFKIPSKVIFIDHIPKNDTGKIDRKKIKENYFKSQAKG